MQFAVDELQRNPSLTYVELRELAHARGLLLPPILFGRARIHLGLPTTPTLQRAAHPPAHAAAEATAGEVAAGTEPMPARPVRRETPARQPPPTPAKQQLRPVEQAEPAAETNHDMVAPRSQRSGAFEFAVDMLRVEPALEYGILRLRGEASGHRIPPILYGRAKAYLGLVPVKPRGTKAKQDGNARGPLQLRQVESIVEVQREALKRATGLGSIEELTEQLRQVARERDELRAAVREREALRGALQRIAVLIDQLHRELEPS